MSGHSGCVFASAFNFKGNLLVSCSFDESVIVWDIRNGAIVHVIPAHSDGVTSVSFSPDGRSIVSGSYEGIWYTAASHIILTCF